MNHALLLVALLASGQADKPRKAETIAPDPSWKSLGDNLWFDAKSKTLIVKAKVTLREGPLEHLLCLQGTKEHESILATAAAPKRIHAGLLLTGAEAGHPVRFQPKFEAPAGSAMSIRLEWNEGGKRKSADARSWVTDLKEKKPLAIDWVFAGSDIFVDPISKEKIYGADDGDLITVANFPASILDLPFRSSQSDGERLYVANTPAVPDRETEVLMYFTPKPTTKDKPKS